MQTQQFSIYEFNLQGECNKGADDIFHFYSIWNRSNFSFAVSIILDLSIAEGATSQVWLLVPFLLFLGWRRVNQWHDNLELHIK